MPTKKTQEIIDIITKEEPMPDEGPIRGWGKDSQTDAPLVTGTENKLRGKYRQSGYMPTSEDTYQKEKESLSQDVDPLEEHIVAISAAIERGHKFKSAHMEVCARVIQTDLSEEAKGWQGEIHRSIHQRPLYQCYNGWYMSCCDNGMAQSPHFDVAWAQDTTFDPNMANCDECTKSFRQERFGQKYCSKLCGSKADKRKLEKLIASRPQEHPLAEV